MKKSGRDATLIYAYRDNTCTNQTTVEAARFLAT